MGLEFSLFATHNTRPAQDQRNVVYSSNFLHKTGDMRYPHSLGLHNAAQHAALPNR